MSLRDRINEDLKAAMKAGDKIRTETIRGLRAGIIEFEKSGAGREMTVEDDLKILTGAAKKRREAIELYEQNNRPELAEKEKAELAVIQEYLPKQMTREEIAERISQIITETGAAGLQDSNKVMPVIMKEVKGKADGRLVQEIVKERLAALIT
ncbi:MAG: GatB/YqeY domain-containing protein [Bacteroidota bacterium]|nr:GatB/YqeY domain-containing protein [Bacteroidota bacterium]MDP4232734.1 GatB/YqeY domain-containing protein [Bacteroidota bacterium]MDP4244050.1 GatB/YqeY domain-containing protein [Bacteroidota bacterium]MDP4287590.1 GatB/YqeY domain-containing protein [Bacteroidota bacterium]